MQSKCQFLGQIPEDSSPSHHLLVHFQKLDEPDAVHTSSVDDSTPVGGESHRNSAYSLLPSFFSLLDGQCCHVALADAPQYRTSRFVRAPQILECQHVARNVEGYHHWLCAQNCGPRCSDTRVPVSDDFDSGERFQQHCILCTVLLVVAGYFGSRIPHLLRHTQPGKSVSSGRLPWI